VQSLRNADGTADFVGDFAEGWRGRRRHGWSLRWSLCLRQCGA
jgi:hypothetical protein